MKIKEGDDDYQSVDLSEESKDSHNNPLLHPNEEQNDLKPKFKGSCAKYLYRFDELIMKPIFIYKYERNMQKKSE